MARVCVIGGGTAGTQAALEAACMGAEVTIVDRLDTPEPPWKAWPDLIHPRPRGREAPDSHVFRCSQSWASILTSEVRSASRGAITTSEGRKAGFDSVVVATGCFFEPATLPGFRKSGVFVLDGARKYAEVGRAISSVEEVLVAGEGFRGLEAAEKLGGRGRRVSLIVSHWQWEAPSPVAFQVIVEAAQEKGVRVLGGTLTRAVGAGMVEAVVADGSVLPCDALVIVPRRVPRMIQVEARRGSRGGLLVDRLMKTSAESTYAAGGCAELEGAIPPRATLEREAGLSGRIAGSNCMGTKHAIGLVRFNELYVFGLRWTRVGMGPVSARASGLVVSDVERRWGRTSACSVAYERFTGRVMGVESVEATNISPVSLPPLESGATLKTLAFSGLGSSDISLVSETARLGIGSWPRS